MYRIRVIFLKNFACFFLLSFSRDVSFLSSYSLFLPVDTLPYTHFPSFLAFRRTGVVPIMASNFSPVLILQQYFTRRFEQVS
jgi:hypothetical protein